MRWLRSDTAQRSNWFSNCCWSLGLHRSSLLLAFLRRHVGRVAAAVGEPLVTEPALERLVSRVDPDVLLIIKVVKYLNRGLSSANL